MKKNKLFALLITSALATSVMVGCGEKVETPAEVPNTPPVEEPEAQDEESSKIVKAGLGVVTSIVKSGSLMEGEAKAQVDTTMASVGFDKDGKIVSINIDVAQSKVGFDAEMQVTSNLENMGKTKKELGNDYGMKKASGIAKEWFEQIEALENWMIGKTAEEVLAMKMVERDGTITANTDEADLKSSVTITVDGYLAAVAKAFENVVDVEGEIVGLGQNISLGKSKSQDGENGAVAQVDTTVVLTVLDRDGKVARTIIDVAQTKVQYDVDGYIETSLEDPIQTKKEIGEDYGMIKASTIGKEWFEQIASLEEWMTGKTVDEVLNMSLIETVPAEEDLTSSVTIKVNGYLDAFKEASESAK